MFLKMLREFHAKHRFAQNLDLPSMAKAHEGNSIYLKRLGGQLVSIAVMEEKIAVENQREGDPRLYRLCLMLEELGEIALAYADGNELEALDGHADLTYVNVGSCDTFNLPHDLAVKEVHRSNMTKLARDPETNPRMRNKGPDYTEPDLKNLLDLPSRPPAFQDGEER